MTTTSSSIRTTSNGSSNNSSVVGLPTVWDDNNNANGSSSSTTTDQLFFVTSYSDFDKLAHGPRGTRAEHSVYVYRFDPTDNGSLVLLNVKNGITNPAFSRHHPHLNVIYTCTEDIEENGKIYCFGISGDGNLTQLCDPVDAGGTSTCYLTIDRAAENLLCVNYWDSTLAVIPLSHEGSFVGPISHMYDPKQGQAMVAAGRCNGGVNHSHNDSSTIRMRQADPHSHALVLDPWVGTVAYVPDLGKDVIREFYYDRSNGKIAHELNVLPSSLQTGQPDGPRYFEFHPTHNVAYVINELSSTISVFEVDRALLTELGNADSDNLEPFVGRSTLRLVQSIKTIPSAFPTTLNTCGRICVHQSGRFVVVSNRGHQSIAIFRVSKKGNLRSIGYFHTRGETPRHFQFDASGQYLLIANQDTDSLAVFSFNISSGAITYTGNEYRVPSPNFVCGCEVVASIGATTIAAANTAANIEAAPPVVVPQRHGFLSRSESSGSEEDNIVVSKEKQEINLAEELAQARREIALLRRQLLLNNNNKKE